MENLAQFLIIFFSPMIIGEMFDYRSPSDRENYKQNIVAIMIILFIVAFAGAYLWV